MGSLVHQRALAKLYDRIRPWLTETGLGEMLWSSAGMSQGEDDLLPPDLFVYRPAPGPRPEEWSEITDLLLVIEAKTPETAHADRVVKRHRHQSAGVPQYWIVHLDGCVIERWEPTDTRPEMLDQELIWDPGTGVAPLRIDVADYFAEVLGVAGDGQETALPYGG